MFFSRAVVALSFAFGAIAIPASIPLAADGEMEVVKRATEGIHLVNCVGPERYSIIIYCPNDGDCNHLASTDNQCFSNAGGLTTWETSGGCAFTSGTVFSYTIQANAQSRPNYSQVGTGRNPYHDYKIYKDDQHVMYTEGSGNVCRSIYYALPMQLESTPVQWTPVLAEELHPPQRHGPLRTGASMTRR
ncbi:hypothetical protein B0T19DRAFT_398503 [Cercophora scortea]|uniref:Uncharacterized protein n=1 Tax=Cercophora scortea TaxID=314031 RepID=A0AAE0IY98_9PEZI|nr:hypothetical protein B0T19DRAFT_398503 [Cercophora scortea]